MKFYYAPISPNCRRALAVAHHLGFEPEMVPVAFFSPDFDHASFQRKNPNGAVPVLEDGSFTLWESNAIMQYLADKKGNTDLFPKDFSIRSDISRWQFWSLATFERASGAALWENGLKKFLGAGEPDPSLVKASEEDFLAALKVLNDHLANRNYLVTDNITLADYAFSGTMMFAEDAKYPLADFPHVQKWWARIQSQDGWKKSGEHVMTPKQLMARK